MLNKKFTIIFISIFIVFLLGITSFFIVQNIKDNNQTINKIDISNWKNYQDKKYGFSLKVPKDWLVEDGVDDQINLLVFKDSNNKQQITISITQNYKDEKELFKGLCYELNNEELKECKEAEQGTINFNAGIGYVYDGSFYDEKKNQKRFIILANKRLTFSIVDYNPKLNKENNKELKEIKTTINNIINTIQVDKEWKDIDQTENIKQFLDGEYELPKTTLPNQKTYRNEKYGFEMEIPEDWECEEFSNSKNVLVKYTTKIVCANENKVKLFRKEYKQTREFNVDWSLDGITINLQPSFMESLARLYAPEDMAIRKWAFIIQNKFINTTKYKDIDFVINNIIINNKTGIVSSYVSNIGGPVCTGIFDNNYYYEICREEHLEGLNYISHKKIFDNILKTFKFLD